MAGSSNNPPLNMTAVPNLPVPIDRYKLVYYDLETTGFSLFSQVMQIAARSDNDEYSSYIQPEDILPQSVTETTGLEAKEGMLYLNGLRVDTVSCSDAWTGLIDFLAKFEAPVILVGHNINFDIRFTTQETDWLGLKPRFDSVVYGVVDTVKLLKTTLPGRANYKQNDIAASLGASDETLGAHNALGDVRTLQNIIMKLEISEETLKSYYQSFASQIEKKRKDAAKKENLKTFSMFKDEFSNVMLHRIAANFSLVDLKNVYTQSGEEGLQALFSENCNGRPRVTKDKEVVRTVIVILGSNTDKVVNVEK